MIRKANINDAEELAKIYANARQYMIDCGFEQWVNGYPSIDDVKNDIANGVCHLLEDDEGIYGAFAMIGGNDPTYDYIENGEWISNEPYLTLHRVASSGRVRNTFSQMVEYAKGINPHLRVDTHKDNKKMQNAILRNGFEYRGIIYLVNGDPRRAYELYEV